MACDDLLYVSAHVSPLAAEQAETPQSVFAHWRSAEAWYRDAPSDPRRPCSQPGTLSVARTSHRRDVVVVSPLFRVTVLHYHLCYTCLPGEAESALQACNR